VIRRLLSLLVFATCRVVACANDAGAGWSPTSWNGEKSLASTSQGWKAVVSLVRGRLVYFGPAERDANLLFATPTRDDPAGWGGHRLWLGPQLTWAKIWPPPAAWEHSGPEHFTTDGSLLRLVMFDPGDGWPLLTRTYQWAGAKLVCGAELSGGTKPAQIIQIIQVPQSAWAEVHAQPDATAPAGYVVLPSAQTPRLMTEFAQAPHVTRNGDTLQLRYLGITLKLGFRPQILLGRVGDRTLGVDRYTSAGTIAASPDEGFFTQVFLGGHEPFIELEQLSPVYAPGTSASFAIVLEGAVR
jgi:hypothetical protein